MRSPIRTHRHTEEGRGRQRYINTKRERRDREGYRPTLIYIHKHMHRQREGGRRAMSLHRGFASFPAKTQPTTASAAAASHCSRLIATSVISQNVCGIYPQPQIFIPSPPSRRFPRSKYKKGTRTKTSKPTEKSKLTARANVFIVAFVSLSETSRSLRDNFRFLSPEMNEDNGEGHRQDGGCPLAFLEKVLMEAVSFKRNFTVAIPLSSIKTTENGGYFVYRRKTQIMTVFLSEMVDVLWQ